MTAPASITIAVRLPLALAEHLDDMAYRQQVQNGSGRRVTRSDVIRHLLENAVPRVRTRRPFRPSRA